MMLALTVRCAAPAMGRCTTALPRAPTLAATVRLFTTSSVPKLLAPARLPRHYSTPPASIPPADYDGMPRYPNFTPGGALRAMDYIGTVAFAMSGCITAGLTGMDLLGCVVVGTITSIGGGTIRDLLIGNSPVFWVVEYEYLIMCLVVATATFFFLVAFGQKDEPALLWWADTVGVGAFCVIGAQNGIRRGCHPLICVACGMFTATFGGAIRDVLCNRPVRILHSHAEIYASTAIAGATVYMATKVAGLPLVYRIGTGFTVAAVLRIVATEKGIRLPVLPEKVRFS
eukprot:GGOE01046307.1.p1 GENE.GGOE01046307.1~~GGOE01046307.1.p1  ORF type:complete len:286 (-),score=61.07 GGOE01046307.1:398-1255(-)